MKGKSGVWSLSTCGEEHSLCTELQGLPPRKREREKKKDKKEKKWKKEHKKNNGEGDSNECDCKVSSLPGPGCCSHATLEPRSSLDFFFRFKPCRVEFLEMNLWSEFVVISVQSQRVFRIGLGIPHPMQLC